MSTVDKVCPVVFRDASMQQILAFEHPKSGARREREARRELEGALPPCAGCHPRAHAPAALAWRTSEGSIAFPTGPPRLHC
jgi:hypothetical protein